MSALKSQTFTLENQDGCGEDTLFEVSETLNGRVCITFKGRDETDVVIESFGEEIRLLVYSDEEEPQVVVLNAISGGW